MPISKLRNSLIFTVFLFMLSSLASISAQESPSSPCDGKSLGFNAKTCKLKVKFKDRSDCPEIVSWKWEFGDGTRAVGKKPQHKFSFVGTYNVTVYYYDADGNQIGTASQELHLTK